MQHSGNSGLLSASSANSALHSVAQDGNVVRACFIKTIVQAKVGAYYSSANVKGIALVNCNVDKSLTWHKSPVMMEAATMKVNCRTTYILVIAIRQ